MAELVTYVEGPVPVRVASLLEVGFGIAVPRALGEAGVSEVFLSLGFQ